MAQFDSATISVSSSLGGVLQDLLNADDILPGDEPSYQLCKSLFISHPLGGKMAETPIRLAQSQGREIAVPDSPEEEVVRAFEDAAKEIENERRILNVMTQSRVYGIASVAMIEAGKKAEEDVGQPVDLRELWRKDLEFNTWDPLNTAGSLITSQVPTSAMFQKWGDLWVNGLRYHRSRTVTVMNEEPLYIAWTSSAYGYVGRSVYQRAFYPLKSFLNTMITDNMVTRKAGLIVARLEQVGSIVDRIMQTMFGVKRSILQRGATNNVISIGKDELIETLNLRNVNDAMAESRNNIIKNIATAADMPAKMLTQESFVEGFGEGTQDAYAVAQYVDRVRVEMQNVYRWFDAVTMYRAWNPEFYQTIQRRFPDPYGDMSYETAFYKWRNSFTATWPSLIKEKPSEAVELDKVKLEALMSILQVLLPVLDPENKAALIQSVYDNLNAFDKLFGGQKFELDAEVLSDHLAKAQEEAEQSAQMGHNGGPPMDGEEGGEKEPEQPQPRTMRLSQSDAARAAGGIIELMRKRELTAR